MKHSIKMLEVEQPIGTFYIGKIETETLLKIYKINRRDSDTNVGIQRRLQDNRAKEIATYCESPDASFPTPIILAVNSKEIIMNLFDGFITLSFSDETRFAEILDGQHRIEGIKLAAQYPKEMVLVIMLDLTEEEKA